MEVFVFTKAINAETVYPVTHDDSYLYVTEKEQMDIRDKLTYAMYLGGFHHQYCYNDILLKYLIYTTAPFPNSKYIVYNYLDKDNFHIIWFDYVESYKCHSLYMHTTKE
jgi:hypothetical protein